MEFEDFEIPSGVYEDVEYSDDQPLQYSDDQPLQYSEEEPLKYSKDSDGTPPIKVTRESSSDEFKEEKPEMKATFKEMGHKAVFHMAEKGRKSFEEKMRGELVGLIESDWNLSVQTVADFFMSIPLIEQLNIRLLTYAYYFDKNYTLTKKNLGKFLEGRSDVNRIDLIRYIRFIDRTK